MQQQSQDDLQAQAIARQVAAAVRAACLDAAGAAYEAARIDGLCHEGAWENALEAIRALDLAAIVAGAGQGQQRSLRFPDAKV